MWRAVLALTALLATAAPAQAALITTWSADLDATFDTAAPVFRAGDGTPTVTPKLIEWGTTAISSLSLGDAQTGVEIITNGTAVPGVPLTHVNNVLSASDASLARGTIALSVDLTSVPPGATHLLSFDRIIEFIETPNAAVPCAAGDPNPCDDFLVFSAPNPEASQFVIDGVQYTLEVSLDGLTTLSDSACATLGFASGCRGLITVEDATNVFTPDIRITAVAVSATTPFTLVAALIAWLIS
jgi:hypothetical protein